MFTDSIPKVMQPRIHAARRIRGEGHTHFLRDAKKILAAAGRRLEHHIEARMVTSPEHETYTQIHWDVARWIDEGLLDGVNLKYLNPWNPWLHREVLPRTAARSIPIHMVGALCDPRCHPRSPELHKDMWKILESAGLDALNLYEAWIYIRQTPDGLRWLRGSSREIFRRLSSLCERGRSR